MGRSANPFKRFVHNCDRMQLLSVHTDKLFKVPGMSEIVPSSTQLPLFSILCLMLFHGHCRKYKSQNAKCLFQFSPWLISLSRVWCCGWREGDFIVQKTKRNYTENNFRCNAQLLPAFHFTFVMFTYSDFILNFLLKFWDLMLFTSGGSKQRLLGKDLTESSF